LTSVYVAHSLRSAQAKVLVGLRILQPSTAKGKTMKAIRSVFLLVFVLSLTLMSVLPVAADSAVTGFSGTVTMDYPYGFGSWVWEQHGVSWHVTDAGFVYRIDVNNDAVNGVVWLLADNAIVNAWVANKGPFQGSFWIETDEGVIWEGHVVSRPAPDPMVWQFAGHGVGSNAGLNLKMTMTFLNNNFLNGTVVGQVIGK
jgi:hypothetical protein